MLRRSHSFSSTNKVDTEGEAEEEEGDGNSVINEYERNEKYSILKWPIGKNRKPLVNFAAACVLLGTPEDSLDTIKKYHLGYKFVKTECKLVRNILGAHGFKETHPNGTQFNLMWTGSHLKPYTLRALTESQKVNHFPRSYELTRKDRLYKNIQRMQHAKGFRHFDFIPGSYVLPSELSDFYAAFLKDRGPWIVKPCASSRGRGIYLINHTNQIPVDENVLVCKYIDNPLLINGFKFDCRIYVAVTSYDPLRVYVFEEGLARFSTVKYEKGTGNLRNQWMHLTNYSINKNSEDYVRCEDPEVDDYGSKWSFSAMLRRLKEAGKDTQAMMARIEDVIIKTIISGEMAIATACKMFVPYRGNCFELFGFDILIDESLKPWLLEVNLSPSLACDSPLDLKIKANLITDLFNLTGFVADDPTLKKPPKLITEQRKKQRYPSASYSTADLKSLAAKSLNRINDGLSNEERRLLRETKEEYKRRGGFIRIYPSPESWELYGSIQEHQTTHNRMIHSRIYPELWRCSQRPQSATYIARARNFSSNNKSLVSEASEGSLNISGQNFHRRYVQFERKLESWSLFQTSMSSETQDLQVTTNTKPHLAQGQLDDQEQKQAFVSTPVLKNTFVSVPDIVKKGQHLRTFQAREAFAIYLQRVQHRLLQEIRSSNSNPYTKSFEDVQKQEQQIDLIHRFLLKAAVNLSNPINIIVPHQNLPILDRKKILARQLSDFVRVYTRETNLLCEIDDENNNVQNEVIEQDVFKLFLAIASESELEEILTIYTRHNKSASIFLGAKPMRKADSRVVEQNEQKNRRSTSSKSSASAKLGDNYNRRVLGSSMRRTLSSNVLSDQTLESLNRPKSGRHSLKQSSTNSEIQLKDAELPRMYKEINSRPPSGKSTSSLSKTNENRHLRHLSADARIRSRPHSGNDQHARQSDSRTTLSVGKFERPDSSKQRLRNISTVCAYTGTSELLRHRQQSEEKSSRSNSNAPSRSTSRPSSSSYHTKNVFGVDDPQLTEALNKLSTKQCERTYSTNNIKPCLQSNSNLLNNQVPVDKKTLDLEQHSIRVYNELNNSDGGDIDADETFEKFVKYGERFVQENQKDFSVSRNNYQHQTTSTQTVETCVSKLNVCPPKDEKVERRWVSVKPNYNAPRPPEGRKPLIKKQINSQRMSRLVGKK